MPAGKRDDMRGFENSLPKKVVDVDPELQRGLAALAAADRDNALRGAIDLLREAAKLATAADRAELDGDAIAAGIFREGVRKALHAGTNLAISAQSAEVAVRSHNELARGAR